MHPIRYLIYGSVLQSIGLLAYITNNNIFAFFFLFTGLACYVRQMVEKNDEQKPLHTPSGEAGNL